MSHWRLSDWTLSLLVTLAVMAAWEGYVLNHRQETRGCGGDFLQFYFSGAIVNRGEAERLYDQPYFRHLQQSLRDDPLCSLYPPTMGLLMSPLARLSCDKALIAWWALQAVCLVATGVIFYRTTPLPRPWRINMLVALAALEPLWIAVGIGHLAPMLLLILSGGLTLHRRGNCCWAGLLLSLLALKPQLAAGMFLWMLLRRDLRTLLGLTAGFAVQGLAVAVLLGPARWLDYLHAMPTISAITRAYHYSPVFEQSFAGIAANLLLVADRTAWEVAAMRITYAITAGAAAVLLCRVVWAGRAVGNALRGVPGQAERDGARSLQIPDTGPPPAPCENYEYACGVLFMTLFPPYFLVYDQTLLAIPLVMLWSSPAWRWGVALFAAMTVVATNFGFAINCSLTGVVALAIMFALAVRVTVASYGCTAAVASSGTGGMSA
jgi:hypothetical protein